MAGGGRESDRKIVVKCYTLGRTVMLGPIEINPNVMHGKPVIRNTRIPVELLLRLQGAFTVLQPGVVRISKP